MLVDLITFLSYSQSDYLEQCNKSFEYNRGKKKGIIWSNVARDGHADSIRHLLAEGELLVSEYLYALDNKPHQYLL